MKYFRSLAISMLLTNFSYEFSELVKIMVINKMYYVNKTYYYVNFVSILSIRNNSLYVRDKGI